MNGQYMPNDYTTILIGNGLGMAVDANYFKLNAGLNFAWQKLSEEQQNTIRLIENKTITGNVEERLKHHYDAIQAIITLTKIKKNTNQEWLHHNAVDFRRYFRSFITNAASYFFDYETGFEENISSLQNFIQNLKNFIEINNTHIMTLNYDRLIYEQIVNCDRLKEKLTDGFNPRDGGFKRQILENYYGCRGYYLHLHGSPLFYSDVINKVINKDSYYDYPNNINNKNYLRNHIILCATSQKPTRITSSSLLKAYWYFYQKALAQSEKIILFGYSGNDPHVNSVLTKHLSEKDIIVVEYSGLDDIKSRRIFWEKKLALADGYFNDKNLIRLNSILDYNFN